MINKFRMENSCFISLDKSHFHMVINLLIAVLVLHMHILTPISADKILQLRYINWSTNFRGLPFNEEMASF